MQQDSCERALGMTRDTHWWALAAMALLEENLKWLSHSVSHGWSGSHQWSGSHLHFGSHRCLGSHQSYQNRSHQSTAPQAEACQGGTFKRHALSPSPEWLRRHVTLDDDLESTRTGESHPLTWGAWENPAPRGTQQWRSFHHQPHQQKTCPDWSQPLKGDPPSTTALNGLHGEPIRSTWWPELSMVPGERDVEEFAWKVQGLFELPKRRSYAWDTANDYFTPSPFIP